MGRSIQRALRLLGEIIAEVRTEELEIARRLDLADRLEQVKEDIEADVKDGDHRAAARRRALLRLELEG